MRQGVSLQKITEFIVDSWLWNWPDWKKRRPEDQNQRTHRDRTQSLVASQSGKPAHKSLPQIAPGGRHALCKSAENCDQYRAINELTEVHVTKTASLSSTLLKHEPYSRV